MVAVHARGTYLLSDGTPARGDITFAPRVAAVNDNADDNIMVGAKVRTSLNQQGSFSVTLQPSDDAMITPNGWTYQVTEEILGVAARTYDIEVPTSALAEGIDLVTVAPVSASDGTPSAFVTLVAFAGEVTARIAGDAANAAAIASEATTRAAADTAEATTRAAADGAETAARTAADALLVPLASVGAANGVAPLDAGAKVPVVNLPAVVINDTFVVASLAAMLALTAQRGDVAIRTDVAKTFILATDSPTTLADWKELPTPADAVTSVDGRAGVVSLADRYLAYLQAAALPDLLIVGTITRDTNEAATLAPVVWPDGAPGVYTATVVSTAFPGAVDAYTITYGSPVTRTYTQPAVTRDASGAVTTRPAITVA